jgi:hypothetical protein
MSTFVSYVRDVSASPHALPASVKKPTVAGTVTFDNDVKASSDPTSTRSRAYLQLLSDLWRIHHPAYVELSDQDDAGVRTIVRVHVPLVVWVTGLASLEVGVGVTLHVSCARHVLLKTNPRFAELFDILRNALGTSARVAVTEDPTDHRIIDVAPFDELPNPAPEVVSDALTAAAVIPSVAKSSAKKKKKKKRPLTPQQLFTLVSKAACNPAKPGHSCIPFLFPRDGCWARAHEMCRLMIAVGAAPRKVWVSVSASSLMKVRTANDPACEVSWSFHVAPLVGKGRASRVIDPATCRRAVSLSVWLKRMHPSHPHRIETASSAYRPHVEANFGDHHNQFTRDDDFSETAHDLGVFQSQLSAQTIANGPAPFAPCANT